MSNREPHRTVRTGDDHYRRGMAHVAIAGIEVAKFVVYAVIAVLVIALAVIVGTFIL